MYLTALLLFMQNTCTLWWFNISLNYLTKYEGCGFHFHPNLCTTEIKWTCQHQLIRLSCNRSCLRVLPVHHLPFPLACDHVQQGLSEVVSDAAITNHLIPKDDETQVVDILYVVLLYVHPILWDKHTEKDNNDYTHLPHQHLLCG